MRRLSWIALTAVILTVGSAAADPVRLSDPTPSTMAGVQWHRTTPDGSRVVYGQELITTFDVELYSVGVDGDPGPERLSGLGTATSSSLMRITPDGGRVLYVAAQESPNPYLYSVPTAGTSADVVRLNPDLGDFDSLVNTIEVAPDSSSVAFQVYYGLDFTYQVFIAPVDGSAPATPLTVPLPDSASVFWFSADSGRLVFKQDGFVYSVPTDASSAPVQLNPAPHPFSEVLYFAVSPDGTRVVFRGWILSETVFDLFSVPIAGPAAAAVKLNPAYVSGRGVGSAVITPDSGSVLYTGNPVFLGQQNLYIVPIDGSASATRLNPLFPYIASAGVGQYAVTADSSRVVYRADAGAPDEFELFSVPVASPGSATTLNGPLTTGGDVVNFKVSDDGQWVVYKADQLADGVYQGWRAPVAGPGGSSTRLWSDIWPWSSDSWVYDLTADSRYVVLYGDRDGGARSDGSERGSSANRLWAIPLEGDSPEQRLVELVDESLFAPTGDVLSFAVSPDGARVVYRADKVFDESYDLYSVELPILADGFEAGTTTAWSSEAP